MYVLDAAKSHSCQEELSSGEDKARVAVATVAVDALQCDPEPREAKGVCQLSLMNILHFQKRVSNLASAKTCPIQ